MADKPENPPAIDAAEYASLLDEILEQDVLNEEIEPTPRTNEEEAIETTDAARPQPAYHLLNRCICAAGLVQLLLTITLGLVILLEPTSFSRTASRADLLRKLGPDARFFIAFEKLSQCVASSVPCSTLDKIVTEYNAILRSGKDGFPEDYRQEDFFADGFISTPGGGVVYSELK